MCGIFSILNLCHTNELIEMILIKVLEEDQNFHRLIVLKTQIV